MICIAVEACEPGNKKTSEKGILYLSLSRETGFVSTDRTPDKALRYFVAPTSHRTPGARHHGGRGGHGLQATRCGVRRPLPLQQFEVAAVMRLQGGAALHPVAVVAVQGAVDLAHFGTVDVADKSPLPLMGELADLVKRPLLR